MLMNKGTISALLAVISLLLPFSACAEGEIYKVVDKDGNVTFTDQRPSADAQPMNLPPLSVVETDSSTLTATPSAGSKEEEAGPPTTRQLRQQFRDFRITRPLPEETFWGTDNTVVVTWESSQPIPEDMNVLLYVDGKSQPASVSGGVSLTLDRGEHQVYAELRDQRNRRVLTTPTVTFFVKQASVARPVASPHNGAP